VLYSGPLSNAKAVFAVGTFDLVAEIWDGVGAFTEYSIDPAFKVKANLLYICIFRA
jgi:hypothetical protein